MLMEPLKIADTPFVHRLEGLRWTHDYLFNGRQLLSNRHVYTVFCHLPSSPDTEPGAEYEDVSSDVERLTILSPEFFLWLVNIRPGYLVLAIDRGVIIEPYTPSRFAHQLGYDQLYTGNPNPGLQLSGSLLDAARASYCNVSGCTGAKFRLSVSNAKP